MNFRTSYLVGLIASALLVFSVSPLVQTAFAAEPLKITGPDGEVRQTYRQYGPTRSSDTFWSIAKKVRPDKSISIYQAMAAIYDANPHAFSNASFNSLEKGMILLIPSRELMLAIPKSMAKARAERGNKGVKKTARPKMVQATQAVPPPVITSARPAAVAPTPVDTKKVNNPAASDVIMALTAKLEAAEAKNLQLTDELGRAQDQLELDDSDTEKLKSTIDELNEQVAILEEQLQASKLQAARSSEKVNFLQEQINALQSVAPAKETYLWRNVMDNPLLLIGAVSIPALSLLTLLWLFLRRRRDKAASTEEQAAKETAVEDEPVTSANTSESSAKDDLEAMAIHLDVEEDNINSIMDINTPEPQPKQGMNADEPIDLASDMFAELSQNPSHQESVEEEGQSLDDLWAEAMGEQDKEETHAGEDDLNSLLAGFDEPSTPDYAADNLSQEIAAELEQDVTTTAEEETLADVNVATRDVENDDVKKDSEANSQEDLDSLLAGFDVPATDSDGETAAEVDLSEAISAELEGEVDIDQGASVEDIDALLAGFEQQNDAASIDTQLNTGLDTQLDAGLDTQLDTQLDTRAADESPAGILGEPDVDLSHAISSELEDEMNKSSSSSADELDSLLAEFDIADTGIAEQLDRPAPFDDGLLAPATDSSPQVEPNGDVSLDALLADLESIEPQANLDPVASKPVDDMLTELKDDKKADDNSLDWEPESSAQLQQPVIAPASNAELLSSSTEAKSTDSELSLSLQDAEQLTVDEALAALDAKELATSPAVAVSDHELSSFQMDNGFIDIDRLLNEADEEVLETDQYKELDVDMGELDSLVGNAAMVDVDDAENSVNAKLDLARAYIEIDDNDSAKALLKEVALDGTPRQKEEAEGLINSLD